MAKKVHTYCSGIDWLQLYCLSMRDIPEKGSVGNIRWVRRQYPTAQYLEIIEVYARDEKCTQKFAEVLCRPRLSCLNPRAHQLKIVNKWLYTSRWFHYLKETISALHLQYKSISRLDLYYDCIKYQNGRKPRTLVSDYISRKVLKIGINRGYIAFNDWGYNIPITTQKEAISLNKTLPNINGITWGNKGYIQTQIYNKSLEMRSVKHKEWIARMWSDAGLIGEDVWRTEIRIQKSGKELQLLETGDLFALGISEVADEERIYETFLTYAEKQLRFVKSDYHAKKQQMKPVELFPPLNSLPTFKPKHVCNVSGTNRTLRMVQNYLVQASITLRQSASDAVTRSYAQRLEDAEKTLEWLFREYQFGQPQPRHSPEFEWLARKTLSENWSGEILKPQYPHGTLFAPATH